MEKFLSIPLIDGQKEPSLGGWSGDKATPERLGALDMLAKDSQNHGVLCGKTNGIIVVDYDIYKTDDGYRKIHLDSLRGIHGDNCYIVQTGKGGFHVYHQYNEDVEHWTGQTEIQGYIDVRTTGNYVVGPGSIVNGKEYKLLHSPPDGKLGPVPEEIFNTINEEMKPKKKDTTYDNFDHEEATRLLEQNGFTNVRFINEYNFDCNERRRDGVCPCCGGEHRSNYFFVFKNETGFYVRNHSDKYKSNLKLKSTISFTNVNGARMTQIIERTMTRQRNNLMWHLLTHDQGDGLIA